MASGHHPGQVGDEAGGGDVAFLSPQPGRPDQPALPAFPPYVAAVAADPHPRSQDLAGLGPTDVAFGRGDAANRHPGNVYVRKLAEERREVYGRNGTTAAEKGRLVEEIVHLIKCQTPPGRFVKFDPETGRWKDADEKDVHQKVTNSLRDRHRKATALVAAAAAVAALVEPPTDSDSDEAPPHNENEKVGLLSVELSEEGLLGGVDLADMSLEDEDGGSVAAAAMDVEIGDFLVTAETFELRPDDFLLGRGGGMYSYGVQGRSYLQAEMCSLSKWRL